MSLSDWCGRDFGTGSFYNVLGVKETASTKELKQAYRKISLFLMPSQAPPHRLEEFCCKYETVSKVHRILSDPVTRQVYDAKGDINAIANKLGAFFGNRHFRKTFPHIVPEDIKDFKERYRNSEEEKEDLRNVYLLAEGNMDRLAEIYFAYTAEDKERIFCILKDLIKKKKIPSYEVFITEPPEKVESRKEKYKRPDSGDDNELTSLNPIAMFLRKSRKNIVAHRDWQNEGQKEIPLRKRRRR